MNATRGHQSQTWSYIINTVIKTRTFANEELDSELMSILSSPHQRSPTSL